MEDPVILHDTEEARSVAIALGGGRKANQRLLRSRMVSILTKMMDQQARVHDFASLICDITLPDSRMVIAHYEAIDTGPGELPNIMPILVGSMNTELDAASSTTTENTSSNVGGDSIQSALENSPEVAKRESNIGISPTALNTSNDEFPRLESTFLDNIDLGISSFYVPIAAAMAGMAGEPKSAEVNEANFSNTLYGLRAIIRGVKPPNTRLLTARDVIDSLYTLIQEQLVRVDQQGLPYSPVTSRIYAPEDQHRKIGVLSLQKQAILML